MQSKSDTELLREYAEHGNEPAFTEIVTRHTNVVYSAAVRQVDLPDIAAEITQSVFIGLARGARTLSLRLAEDSSLVGWLCRSARNISLNCRRNEFRQHSRERQAMVQLDPISETAPDWDHLRPVLDEAMSELSESDYDALVMRFFNNQDLRSVGRALGVTDDAAQKRVSRALDKLREHLSRRGISSTATALSIVLSANAVQAAPAGLAATISSAALQAGTSIANTTTASLFRLMITTKSKLVAAVVAAALAIPLAVLLHQNASLREELASIRASALEAQRSRERNSPSGQALIANDELRRLRMEHLELLRLRGRVSQLANELRQGKTAGASPDSSPNPAFEAKKADSILFNASLTNRVGSGQTLLVGGWSVNGVRRYLLLTPIIQKGDGIPDGKPLAVQSQMVTAPESFWNQIGWAAVKSDTRSSTLAGVLTPDQLDSLLEVLKETKDADLSNTSLAKRRNGEYVGIGVAIADEQGTGTMMVIDLNPWIAADGQSVDLEIRPGAVSTNDAVHPSLQSDGQPASPSR